MTRTFQLHRDHDVSGVSGEGVVADGVVFPDGVAVVRWRGDRQSTVVWPSVEDVIAIHGHGGATRLVWDAPAPAPSVVPEATLREHLPVRPDRETIARAIHAAHRPTTGPTPAWDAEAPAWRQTYLDFADAVLALWPGESRATVQAEALHDAADWLADMDDGRDTGYNSAGRDIIARLRDRADRLDKGADRG